ncbi:MAG: mannose-1-phosphate guanylyltransferase/mannose-6-phosphate isomerase, partial [Gammaproteobacteria bacterium]|nr:mannose-1-phosphate guanylyltransferase/mannose-6-phosphate isomerase [Gammaproteobacteria bacterium]
ASKGYLVTFGIVPTHAETGYGYIKKGDALSDHSSKIDAFVEKPDLATATHYLKSGDYFWNSGIFLFSAKTWLEAMDRFRPDINTAVRNAYEKGKQDYDFFRVQKKDFMDCPSESIDYAVMEKVTETGAPKSTLQAAVIPLDAGWSDVGSWQSLWDVGNKDAAGNLIKGDVLLHDTKNSMIFAENRVVAGIGIEHLIVIETADAVLVADKSASQEVKTIVNQLKSAGRSEALMHRRVFRPWGSYEGIGLGERYQVKRITVNPGAALSLQMHHHRAEHWIVVKGTAQVTRGEKTFLLSENESTYIPIGEKHRLENPGAIPLEIVEVQSGGYLGEDDIVRFEDQYGRDSSS